MTTIKIMRFHCSESRETYKEIQHKFDRFLKENSMLYCLEKYTMTLFPGVIILLFPSGSRPDCLV